MILATALPVAATNMSAGSAVLRQQEFNRRSNRNKNQNHIAEFACTDTHTKKRLPTTSIALATL